MMRSNKYADVTSSSCRWLTALVVAGLTFSSATTKAEVGARDVERPESLHIPFEKYRLPNGLEVILAPDKGLPLVAVNIWYHVGPANEPPGRSGFAHLFEHLMFEGSRYAGSQFDTLLESVGATNVNGTTSWDRTNYFETVPSGQLELVLWLESDRMGFMLDTLTLERLNVQREVVKNERRQSYENRPYGPSALALYDALYPEGHPYHGAVIGSMADLDRATMADVKAFFHDYYAPSNATLAIAGDFDSKQIHKLIERYFGTLPTLGSPTRAVEVTPPLSAPLRLAIKEPVEVPKLTFAWRVPPAFSADAAALELAVAILSSGKSSRLYQELVVKEKVATEVSGYVDSNQLCSEANIQAMVASKASLIEVERAAAKVITSLALAGPSASELARAKRRLEVSLKSSLQLLNDGGGEGGRAGTLQRLNHYLGDPGKLDAYFTQVLNVSRDDVRQAVSDYLSERSRITLTTVPQTSATKEAP